MSNTIVSLAFIVCVGIAFPYAKKMIVPFLKKEKKHFATIANQYSSFKDRVINSLRRTLQRDSKIKLSIEEIINSAKLESQKIEERGSEDISLVAERILENAYKEFNNLISSEKSKLIEAILKTATIVTEDLVSQNINHSEINRLSISKMREHINSKKK